MSDDIHIPVPAFVTASQIAVRAGLPVSTVQRRINRLKIAPDAELLRGHESPSPLFAAGKVETIVPMLIEVA